MRQRTPLPVNQIAFAVLDLKRTEQWWREGLGFLPAGGNRMLFRGPLSSWIQKIKGLAMTCWCMVGRNEWAQLELFQYERPHSQLMPRDYHPCDLGYSRCGVWVADFEKALAQLDRLGTKPLSAPMGDVGQRRACVRNPDGVYVELLEADPLPAQTDKGRIGCPVAIRYVTQSTPDVEATTQFMSEGLGMRVVDIRLHDDTHEALWGLAGARCTRRVLVDGSGNESILIETVQYHDPVGKPFPEGYRLCDQRILNVCFGDPRGSKGVLAMRDRSVAAGARPNCPHISLGIAGCVYVEDPLGFSYEFMWASPGLGHRIFGFLPAPQDDRPLADNVGFTLTAEIAASPEAVFALGSDHANMSGWAPRLGATKLLRLGDVERNGRGALRQVGGVIEEITDYVPDVSYRYRILKGAPVVCQTGEMRLVPISVGGKSGTELTWEVRFRSRIPGLGWLIRRIYRSKIESAISGLKQACETRLH